MRRFLAASALVALAACAHQPVKPPAPPTPQPPAQPKAQPQPAPQASLQPVSWDVLKPVEDDLDLAGLEGAFTASAAYYAKLPPATAFDFGGEKVTARDLAETMAALSTMLGEKGLSEKEKVKRLAKSTRVFKSVGSDGAGAVLVTGYYEPWLEGRRAPDAKFMVPLYRRPEDMLTVDLSLFPAAKSQARIVGRAEGGQVLPYFSRGEISSGALSGKGLELLWLEDPVDLFFLQVQGSGRVTLEDGTTVRVQYDAQNGQPYRSLGKALIDKGVLTAEQVSMHSIRKYFQDHPDQLDLLNDNASYTFFRLEDDGPFGNIGVALTPGRSIATDARVFPKGAPAFLRTRKPVIDAKGQVSGWVPMTRFVVNQDTGGAIVGPGRVDLFWGGGPQAEASAGCMKEPGELYFILPVPQSK
jgi:membrane-bound lytic murein transglycosylase A